MTGAPRNFAEFADEENRFNSHPVGHETCTLLPQSHMLTVGSFLILLGALGLCLWWACLDDRNET